MQSKGVPEPQVTGDSNEKKENFTEQPPECHGCGLPDSASGNRTLSDHHVIPFFRTV